MPYSYIASLLKGFGISAGLIVVIGAQNAFVLKQGILKNHVLVMVLICATIDTLLIGVGVGGFGSILASHASLLSLSRWAGAIFLFFYGLRSFCAVFKMQALTMEERRLRAPSLKKLVMTLLALSLLNPHTYLDTIVLLGSISAHYPLHERFFFGIGAVIASFVWFFTLGFGARHLKGVFQNPLAWKILDFIIGCVMWIIAGVLVIADPL